MTATSTTRRPERLTIHLAAPGARIVPADGTSRWSSYGRDYCQGDVRALYGRDKTKAWQRVGWCCTRCGTVELEAGLIGTERDRWYSREHRKLDPEVGYYGRLLPVSTRPAAAPSVDTAPTSPGGDTGGRRAADVAAELDDLLSRRVDVDRGVDTNGQAGVSTPSDRAVSTPSRSTTWDPKAQVPCPDCGDLVSARNLARHRTRVHA